MDAEGQESLQVFEMDDIEIPSDPHPKISKKVTEESFEVPAVPEVKTPDTVESPGLHRYTRLRYQPSTYAPNMTGKRCAFAMMQLESLGEIHPDTHIFVQEDFYYSICVRLL